MVPENEIMPVRIKFKKYGALIYISHLDLSRTMQRIIVRSGIDIWYSEGFNPQPKIVFASPLPLGTESECEYMDIKINSYMPLDEIKERLLKKAPAELCITDVYVPTSKFKEISYMEYVIEIFSEKATQNMADTVSKMFDESVIISKKVKDKEKDINVSEYVKSVSSNFEDGKIKIHTVLCANPDKYLNPEHFTEAVKQKTGLLQSPEDYYSIIRKNMLKSDLSIFR